MEHEWGYREDTFYVDGQSVLAVSGQSSELHGMARRDTLAWSSSSWSSWKLCQVIALPSPWKVTSGGMLHRP